MVLFNEIRKILENKLQKVWLACYHLIQKSLLIKIDIEKLRQAYYNDIRIY